MTISRWPNMAGPPRHDLEAGEDTMAEALLRAADRALYAAKEAGRNRVAPFAPG